MNSKSALTLARPPEGEPRKCSNMFLAPGSHDHIGLRKGWTLAQTKRIAGALDSNVLAV